MRGPLAIAAALVCAALAASAEGGSTVAAAPAQPRFVDASPQRAHARERLAEIRQRIQAALRYPPVARSREQVGTTLMRFDIASDGTPQDVVIHASSGLATLDRAALAAVVAAAPLPWVYGRLEVPVVFELERRR